MSAKPHMGLSVGTSNQPMAFCSPSTKYLSSPSFVTTQPMLWPTLSDSKLNSTFLSWPALWTVLADKIQYSGLRYRSSAPEGTSLSSGHSTVKPNLWKTEGKHVHAQPRVKGRVSSRPRPQRRCSGTVRGILTLGYIRTRLKTHNGSCPSTAFVQEFDLKHASNGDWLFWKHDGFVVAIDSVSYRIVLWQADVCAMLVVKGSLSSAHLLFQCLPPSVVTSASSHCKTCKPHPLSGPSQSQKKERQYRINYNIAPSARFLFACFPLLLAPPHRITRRKNPHG